MATLIDSPAPPVARPEPANSDLRVFRPDIEGLRAVAVGLVVLYHAGLSWIPGGYVGVDVFLVISGFLITSMLLRQFDADGRLSLTDFYARRARRILPIATLVLIASLGASAMFLAASRMGAIGRDGIWTALFASNFRFAISGADYLNATAPPSPLLQFWSLAVEEQFYIVWPALLWVALLIARPGSGRNNRAAAITGTVVAASLAWSIYQTSHDANTAYFSPFTRGWELGAGALIAICAVGLARMPRGAGAALAWVGLGLIIYSALVYDSSTPFPGKAALLPVLGAAGVIAGGLAYTARGPEMILGLSPMQRLGRYSYSLYLWHWPILIIAEQSVTGLSTTAKLVLVVLSVGISALTYHLIENPIRRWPTLVRSNRTTLIAGAGAILVSLLYANMFVVGNNYVVSAAERQFQRQSAASATATTATGADIETAVAAAAKATVVPGAISPPLVVAARDFSPAYTDGCLVEAPATTSPACVFGDPTATKTVVLFGDSHAAQWLPALQNSAGRAKFKIVVLTKGNCPAATMSVYSVEYKRTFTECDKWRSWALDQIATLKPSMVVVSSTFHGVTTPDGQTQTPDVEAMWDSGMQTTLRRLTAASPSVTLLGDVPNHTLPVPDCLAANRTDPLACADPAANAILGAHQTSDELSASSAGVGFLDISSWFCTESTCPAMINGLVTDFDDSHLTTTYSKYLGYALAVKLGLES